MKVDSKIILLLLMCAAHHTVAQREQFSINEAWEFKRGDRAKEEVFDMADSSSWHTVNIPHTWNAEDSLDEDPYYYRGAGWYRKPLQIPPDLLGKNLYLHFEGVNQVAEVYINGRFVGRHAGGYSAFRFKINDYLNNQNPAVNTLAVRVDNSHNDEIPPLQGDWTFFGGMYRDIYLIATHPVHFIMEDAAADGVYLNTPDVNSEVAELAVHAHIRNEQTTPKSVCVQTKLYNAAGLSVAAKEEFLTLTAGQSSQTLSLLEIKNPQLWSPENPALYHVITRLIDAESGELYDELSIPWGFRWYSFDVKNGFMLNGKAMKLIGASRHQDAPYRGNALPDSLHERDISLLKKMGANFLRVAHYPQDPSVMHACDRLGIITSVEIPLVTRITQSEAFFENCKLQMREMILQNYNHPSIVMWSYMNEILLGTNLGKYRPGDRLSEDQQSYLEDVVTLAKELEEIADTMDPDRYTLIANVKWPEIHYATQLTTIPDVVGWNIYSGWYGDRFENMTEFLAEFHKKQPDTPMLISEYGAGSDIRIRSDEPKRFDFSVEWQNHYHEQYVHAIFTNDFVVGGAIWNLADFSSEPRADAVPHINSKGVTTWDRRPKDSYYYYQSRLLTNPVVRVTPALASRKIGVEDSKENPVKQKIRVFSNLDEVEIVHNEMSLGLFAVEDGIARADIDFTPGDNTIEARGLLNGEAVRHTQHYSFESIPKDLDKLFSATGRPLAEIRVNLGAHFWYTDDAGQVWLKDQAYTPGNFGYIGGTVFTIWNGTRIGSHKDILNTTDDPLYQTQRVGLEGYRFDVPDGTYELTLGFAELLSGSERETLAYNLGADDEGGTVIPDRSFSIYANDHCIWDTLNISKQTGEGTAFQRKFVLGAREDQGLKLQFTPIRGEAVLNNIRLKRLD